MYLLLFVLNQFQTEINPDPVFDLTDCNLKSLPNGIYAKCRVYRKEKLLLARNCFKQIPDDTNNKLSDLNGTIKCLDLSYNLIDNLNLQLNVWTSLNVFITLSQKAKLVLFLALFFFFAFSLLGTVSSL